MTADYDDEDVCPICHNLLQDPVKTSCGHSTCRVCLLTWISFANDGPQRIEQSFQIPAKPTIDGLSLTCTLCRAETKAFPDTTRRCQLQQRYPAAYQKRTMEDNGGAINDMVIQIGNKHKTVPPTISPLSGMVRTHYWTFFLVSSQPQVIESVDIILHGTFRNARFVTLRKPPFTKSSLGWGYFELTAFITLREGWEWVSSDAISSTSKGDRRDRLAMKWMLDFDRHGSQSLMMEQFRRRDSWDDIVESLQNLFVDAE